MVVLLIDIGGVPPEEVIAYYKGELGGADHLYAADAGFKVASLYDVLSLGTTIIIDADGLITYRDSGTTPAAGMKEAIGKALR